MSISIKDLGLPCNDLTDLTGTRGAPWLLELWSMGLGCPSGWERPADGRSERQQTSDSAGVVHFFWSVAEVRRLQL